MPSNAPPTTRRVRTSTRHKALPKPQREETKDSEGRFICAWEECSATVKIFKRKCEWNKHMDKHERPYLCDAPGCEKLAGFTYSGGLLRHQREVHEQHGGPKTKYMCPHASCKRHTDKGFSRQENLTEHLRRVHTESGAGRSSPPRVEISGSPRASSGPNRIAGVPEMIVSNVDAIDQISATQRQSCSRQRTGSYDADDIEKDDETERLYRENDQLRQGYDRLCREIQRLKEENARLTQQIIRGRNVLSPKQTSLRRSPFMRSPSSMAITVGDDHDLYEGSGEDEGEGEQNARRKMTSNAMKKKAESQGERTNKRIRTEEN